MTEKRPLIIAHRGARKYAPENTIASFRKAIEIEVDGIEFDVQSTADGVPVVVHDDNLKRLVKKHIHVHKTPYIELSKMDVGSHFNEYYSGEVIPTLKETLEFLKPAGLLVNIEIKKQPHQHRNFLSNVIETIGRLDMNDRVIISSFSKNILYHVGRKAPYLRRSLLLAPRAFFFLDLFFSANILAVWGVNPHISMLNKYVMKFARARNFKVFVWTTNDPEHISKAVCLGVDGLITDDPRLAKIMTR